MAVERSTSAVVAGNPTVHCRKQVRRGVGENAATHIPDGQREDVGGCSVFVSGSGEFLDGLTEFRDAASE